MTRANVLPQKFQRKFFGFVSESKGDGDWHNRAAHWDERAIALDATHDAKHAVARIFDCQSMGRIKFRDAPSVDFQCTHLADPLLPHPLAQGTNTTPERTFSARKFCIESQEFVFAPQDYGACTCSILGTFSTFRRIEWRRA